MTDPEADTSATPASTGEAAPVADTAAPAPSVMPDGVQASAEQVAAADALPVGVPVSPRGDGELTQLRAQVKQLLDDAARDAARIAALEGAMAKAAAAIPSDPAAAAVAALPDLPAQRTGNGLRVH